ncbi:MAG: ABC transporter permease, partial [Verrucomicrobiaceae bacterium]
MFRLVLTRFALFVPTLIAASMILFIAINVVPGSAARSALGVDATPQAIMRFEAMNGLDRPLYVQYAEWFGKAIQGDFGKSFQNRVSVGPEIMKRLPVTLELAIFAFIIANLIAVPLGAIAAYRHTRPTDTVITTLATVLGAIPNFWLATLLVLVFSLKLRWLPAGGYTPFLEDPVKNLQRMILPALSLGVVSSALLLRIMRASMIEVLSSDYIRTAKAKGASDGTVIRRHGLRNAAIPYLTVGAVEFGFLFGGVVIIDSNNSVANNGAIQNKADSGGVGVHILSQFGGNFLNAGSTGGFVSVTGLGA